MPVHSYTLELSQASENPGTHKRGNKREKLLQCSVGDMDMRRATWLSESISAFNIKVVTG